jgi:hypothetical protein
MDGGIDGRPSESLVEMRKTALAPKVSFFLIRSTGEVNIRSNHVMATGRPFMAAWQSNV